MIYVTGDTHGNFERIAEFCGRMGTTKEDILVILGDAGINFHGHGHDALLKQAIEDTIPVTLFCVHGNHERRPETIRTYREIQWHGGTAYAEEAYPDIIFAKDGEFYDLGGLRTMVAGGAYSVDRDFRIAHGWPWWPDEQPSPEIKRRVERALAGAGWKTDVMLSHTVPQKYVPVEAFKSGLDQKTVDTSTEKWLGKIEEKLDYGRWYAGHYHISKTVDRLQIMFEDFRELGK